MSFIMLMDLRLFLNCFSTQCTAHLQFIKREMCAAVSLLVVRFGFVWFGLDWSSSFRISISIRASSLVALLSDCGSLSISLARSLFLSFFLSVCMFSAES